MYNSLGNHELDAHPCAQFLFYPTVRSQGTHPFSQSLYQSTFKPLARKTKENPSKLSGTRIVSCFKVIQKQFTFYKIKPHFNLITLEI